MSRDLSLDMRAAMAAEATDEVFAALITFTHPSRAEPLRLSTDRTEVVSWEPWAQGTRSRDMIFYWTPMSLVLPSEGEDVTPEIRIAADLIDRELLAVLRADPEPAVVRLEIVSADRPDVVEVAHDGFEVQSAPYDEASVSLVIVQPVFAGEPHPADTFNPVSAPGLFR